MKRTFTTRIQPELIHTNASDRQFAKCVLRKEGRVKDFFKRDMQMNLERVVKYANHWDCARNRATRCPVSNVFSCLHFSKTLTFKALIRLDYFLQNLKHENDHSNSPLVYPLRHLLAIGCFFILFPGIFLVDPAAFPHCRLHFETRFRNHSCDYHAAFPTCKSGLVW